MSTLQEPRLYKHAVTLYEQFKSEAHIDPETNELIFEGYTVELAAGLGIAGPTYANAMRALKDMHCIEQIRRGSKHQSSRWSILDEPTITAFQELTHTANPTSRTLEARLKTIEQDVNNLKRKVGDVDIQDALIGLAGSIRELEVHVNKLHKGGSE